MTGFHAMVLADIANADFNGSRFADQRSSSQKFRLATPSLPESLQRPSDTYLAYLKNISGDSTARQN